MHYFKSILAKLFDKSLCLYEQILNFLWVIFLLPFYFLILYTNGYRQISTFQYLGWHLSCRYLTARKNGNKYFVKCGKYFLIKNEVTALSSISKINPSVVPKLYENWLYPRLPINLVVVEFLEGYKPLETMCNLSPQQHELLAKSMYDLLDLLSSISITHRDINPSNVFINENDYSRIKIIDFAMAAGDNMLPLDFLLLNKLVLHSLGCRYRPGKYQWDDLYSVNQVILELKEKVTND